MANPTRKMIDPEKELFGRGIKCLSLFFIDEVAKYRKYDEDGNEVNSEYGEIFEQEYISILNEYLTLFNTPYNRPSTVGSYNMLPASGYQTGMLHTPQSSFPGKPSSALLFPGCFPSQRYVEVHFLRRDVS